MPNHPYTRARQGELALARGRFAEAAAHFAAAVAARPEGDAEWQALLALARLGLGEVAAQTRLAEIAPALDEDARESVRMWLERVAAQLPPEAAAAVAAMRDLLRAGG